MATTCSCPPKNHESAANAPVHTISPTESTKTTPLSPPVFSLYRFGEASLEEMHPGRKEAEEDGRRKAESGGHRKRWRRRKGSVAPGGRGTSTEGRTEKKERGEKMDGEVQVFPEEEKLQ